MGTSFHSPPSMASSTMLVTVTGGFSGWYLVFGYMVLRVVRKRFRWGWLSITLPPRCHLCFRIGSNFICLSLRWQSGVVRFGFRLAPHDVTGARPIRSGRNVIVVNTDFVILKCLRM